MMDFYDSQHLRKVRSRTTLHIIYYWHLLTGLIPVCVGSVCDDDMQL